MFCTGEKLAVQNMGKLNWAILVTVTVTGLVNIPIDFKLMLELG